MDYQRAIKRCGQLLTSHVTRMDNLRQIRAPLLNVFLGEEAEKYSETIRNTYKSCWSGTDDICYLNQAEFSQDQAENAVNSMMRSAACFQYKRMVWMAVYWDITDDHFEDAMEKVQRDIQLAQAIDQSQIFFVFCKETSQQFRQQKQDRLKRLIEWAQDQRKSLVVLSDQTANGTLIGEDISENYRVAANIMLLLNTAYSLDEVNIGQSLAFDLSKNAVHSVGYYYTSKNTDGISRVSLCQVLEDYRRLTERSQNVTGSLKERLCPDGNGYQQLFDEIFETKMLPILPGEEETFLQYLEYTPEMQALNHVNRNTGGFFGFRRTLSDVVEPEKIQSAVSSVGSAWDLCISKYYKSPVQKALQEKRTEIENDLQERVARVLNYEEMCHLLPAGIQELEKTEEPEETYARADLGTMLHRRAMWETRKYVYQELTVYLKNSLAALLNSAKGFGTLLKEVETHLDAENVESSVRIAYGRYTHGKNTSPEQEQLIASKIRPCATEEDLLDQLYEVFAKMVKGDPIYQGSLRDDLNFRIEEAGTMVSDVIEECFSHNLSETIRLITKGVLDEGRSYCMYSDHIDSELYGDVFKAARRDCLERLLIYPVNPDEIIYN